MIRIILFLILFITIVVSLKNILKHNNRISSSSSSSITRLYVATQPAPISKDYDAAAITVLQGLEPVRKRPGMYIGSTGSKGLHHLVFEVVDNSVDEALAGHCTEISVTLLEDGSIEVSDNGRGIPCSVHPTTGKSTLETVLCVLHAGGKFGGDSSGYKVSGGLHGVGISVVNALSEKLVVSVVRNGDKNSMTFSKGIPQTELVVTPALPSENRGTTVVFKPDETIFKTTTDFEFDRLATRIDELAYLNAGLTIKLIDARPKDKRHKTINIKDDEEVLPKKDKKKIKKVEDEPKLDDGAPFVQVFRHDGGIKELVSVMCEEKMNLHPDTAVIGILGEGKGVNVEIAMRWSKDQYTDDMTGFANGIRTSDGGSHIDGLKASVTKTINACAKKLGKLKEGVPNIPGEYLREGLTAVVSVKVPEPEFEGQTKTRLGNPEVRQIVDSIVTDKLNTFFDFNPNILGLIISKALDAQAAALAAKAARELVRRKSLLTSTILPGKLADCSSKNPAESEIYIVEGDSAAGSAKQGRDRQSQAILPLRGKILNIEKASNDKIYQNTELQALISALGLGIRGTEFDLQQLRYHRIVIMTDADVDGAHIRLLLLTFFYRYQKELVKNGYIYIACPPLFKVTTKGKGGEEKYLYDQAAFDSYMKTLPPTANPQIQRFKGLGEMMPAQLWSTTMDPATRTLKAVTIEDAAQADRLFSMLMGDNVVFRKEFISTNADNLKLEDLDF